MTSNPKLTIGMPVYNGELFIKKAIESILDQTFTDFELIISDFDIKIPKLVRDKISKKVKVEVNINLKQK